MSSKKNDTPIGEYLSIHQPEVLELMDQDQPPKSPTDAAMITMSNVNVAIEQAPAISGLDLTNLTLEGLIAKIKDAHGHSAAAAAVRNQFGRHSVEWALAAGVYLNHIKQNKLYGRHGEWEQWLEDTFQGQPQARQLQKYMRLATMWPQIQEEVKANPNSEFAILTIDHALWQVAKPKPTTTNTTMDPAKTTTENAAKTEKDGDEDEEGIITDDGAEQEDQATGPKPPKKKTNGTKNHIPVPRQETALTTAVAFRNAIVLFHDKLMRGEAELEEELPKVLEEIIDYAQGIRLFFEDALDESPSEAA